MFSMPLIDRGALTLPPGTVHLLSGGEAPLPRASAAAYQTYAVDKSSGAPGRARLEATVERVRQRLAASVDVPVQDVGFVASASAALTAAVAAFDWRAGDNVVTLAEEYPSVVLAGIGLDRFAVSTRIVTGGDDPVAALLQTVDARTRLVLVSQVSFRDGLRLDLMALAEALHARGIALGVDASHALGVVPVPAKHCDFVVSCGHKFLLGAHGTGILIWNSARLGQPRPAAGWWSVTDFAISESTARFGYKPGGTAFELGNSDFPALYALEVGLDLVETSGAEAVSHYALDLSGELRQRLVHGGWDVWTPADPEQRGTSIAIACPDSVAVAAMLAEHGIYVASGEGRLRLSIHAFNTTADVARAVGTLSAPGRLQRTDR